MSATGSEVGMSVYYIVTKVSRHCPSCSVTCDMYEKCVDYVDGFSIRQEANNVCGSGQSVVSFAELNMFNDSARRWRKTHLQRHTRQSNSSSHHSSSLPNKRICSSSSSPSSTMAPCVTNSDTTTYSPTSSSLSTSTTKSSILPPPSVSTLSAPLVTQPAVEWDEAFDDIPIKMDAYKHDPAALYRDYGYCIIRGDSGMQQVTAVFNKFVVQQERNLTNINTELFRSHRSEISGKVRQIDINALNGTSIVVPRLLEDADERIRYHLQQVLPPADYQRFVSMKYQLNAAKWLQAKPKQGNQALHLDSVYFERLSVLIYLGDTMSTLLPRYPVSYGMSSNNLYEDIKSLRLWRKDHYYSVPVSSGDILIFKHDIIHAGVENQTKFNRNVLFLLYCPTSSNIADAFQQYEWTWLFFAINRDQTSNEFFASLIRNINYDPLRHFNDLQLRRQIRDELAKLISTQLHHN